MQSLSVWRLAWFGGVQITPVLRILGMTVLIASIAETVVSCAGPLAPVATAVDAANSLPTVIYLTAEAINSGRVVSLPMIDVRSANSRTADPPLAPSVTPTGTSVAGAGMRLAAIQILTPGPSSRVISPLQVQLVAVAGASRTLDVDLFGHDWRLLGHSLVAVPGSPAGDPLSLTMRFEIRTQTENAFLQVSTRDAQGRVQSEMTLPLVLSSIGTNQINPAGNMIFERVMLYDQVPGAIVSGGVVAVQGELMPYKRHPVIVELVSDEDKSLGLRVLTFVGTDWQPFNTTVPYRVRESTPARLYFRQADDILGDQAYMYSQEITLNP